MAILNNGTRGCCAPRVDIQVAARPPEAALGGYSRLGRA